MSKKNENSLIEWAEVIRLQGERYREEQRKIREEKANEMREILGKQTPVKSSQLLVWGKWDNIPQLTTSTPEYLLKSDKILELVWDEMARRSQWLNELADWLDTF